MIVIKASIADPVAASVSIAKPRTYVAPPHVRLTCMFLQCADAYPSPPHMRKCRTGPPEP